MFLIGASWTLQQEAHVRVDIFYSRFSPRTKAWVDLGGSLLMLLPVMLFVAWISWAYVLDSWGVFEGSREAGGLPAVFLLKSVIPLMAVNLLLQGLAETLRKVIVDSRSHAVQIRVGSIDGQSASGRLFDNDAEGG